MGFSQATREGMNRRRQAGYRVSSRLPFGWKPSAFNASVLVPCARERAARERARALREQGASYRAIGAQLTAEGFEPRARAWYPASIKRLIAS